MSCVKRCVVNRLIGFNLTFFVGCFFCSLVSGQTFEMPNMRGAEQFLC